MDKSETIDWLQLRRALTEQPYTQTDVDVWAGNLASIDRGEAVVALRRAAAKGRVTWHTFCDELNAHRRAKTDPRPDLRPDCAHCDGTGWRPTGRATVERCERHTPPGPTVTPAQGVAIAATALEHEMTARGHDPATITATVDRWFR